MDDQHAIEHIARERGYRLLAAYPYGNPVGILVELRAGGLLHHVFGLDVAAVMEEIRRLPDASGPSLADCGV